MAVLAAQHPCLDTSWEPPESATVWTQDMDHMLRLSVRHASFRFDRAAERVRHYVQQTRANGLLPDRVRSDLYDEAACRLRYATLDMIDCTAAAAQSRAAAPAPAARVLLTAAAARAAPAPTLPAMGSDSDDSGDECHTNGVLDAAALRNRMLGLPPPPPAQPMTTHTPEREFVQAAVERGEPAAVERCEPAAVERGEPAAIKLDEQSSQLGELCALGEVLEKRGLGDPVNQLINPLVQMAGRVSELSRAMDSGSLGHDALQDMSELAEQMSEVQRCAMEFQSRALLVPGEVDDAGRSPLDMDLSGVDVEQLLAELEAKALMK